MRIALVDASPKRAGSCSRRLLDSLKKHLEGSAETVDAAMHGFEVPMDAKAALEGADVWVLSYPLYVDGLPAPLVGSLEEMASWEGLSGHTVYAISNCGFYEGEQTGCSLRMVRNWADRYGAGFGGGVGIGGGPALGSFDPDKWAKGPMSPAYDALAAMARDILAGRSFGLRYVRLAMPAGLYRWSGQLMFTRMAKKNGVSKKDIGARATE